MRPARRRPIGSGTESSFEGKLALLLPNVVQQRNVLHGFGAGRFSDEGIDVRRVCASDRTFAVYGGMAPTGWRI